MTHVALVHRDLHQLTRGGICTLYRQLALRLRARGVRVTLITQDTEHPVCAEGIDVVHLPRTEDLAAHRHAVTEVLLGLRPDVVECSTWEAELLHYATYPPAHRAPVLVRGEFSAATLGAPELACAEAALLHRAEDVVAVSDFAAADLTHVYRIRHPDVIHNGVDRTRFHPGPCTAPVSGYRVHLDGVGRVRHRDRLPDLLTGGGHVPPWSPTHRRLPQVVWVGKITPMKGWDRLETAVHALRGRAEVTVVLGHAPTLQEVTLAPDEAVIVQDLDDADMPGLYRAADWVLSTSRWEGFGLALVEAMACATPVLLPADLGTAPELLAAGGGLTYHNHTDLAGILATTPPPAQAPRTFDWDLNARATLARYRTLREARCAC